MCNYVISCCSTADLSKEHFESRDIHYICFHYELDGVQYPDDLGQTMPFDKFYQAMVDGADTKTSQINADEFEERKEVSKGDTYQLHDTVVVIEDITTAGEVTIKFEPAVINVDTDELTEIMVIDSEDILNVKEVCNDGDTATWQFRVISNRYQ